MCTISPASPVSPVTAAGGLSWHSASTTAGARGNPVEVRARRQRRGDRRQRIRHLFFNIQPQLTDVDHITNFDVAPDTIDIRYQHGYEPTITMTAGNDKFADMSVDLVLHVRDDAGEAGTIVLDHIAIADIDDVMGQINFQEVA